MANKEQLTESVNEAVRPTITVEDILAEVSDLERQNELLIKQHIGLENRYNQEKARWRQYKADMLAENEALRNRNIMLETLEEKRCKAADQERERRVETVPKLVIIAAACLGLCCIPWALQKLSIIGPQLGYALQTGFMMAISWCYALIWDRTRK